MWTFPSESDNLVKQVFGGRVIIKQLSDTYEPLVDLSLEILGRGGRSGEKKLTFTVEEIRWRSVVKKNLKFADIKRKKERGWMSAAISKPTEEKNFAIQHEPAFFKKGEEGIDKYIDDLNQKPKNLGTSDSSNANAISESMLTDTVWASAGEKKVWASAGEKKVVVSTASACEKKVWASQVRKRWLGCGVQPARRCALVLEGVNFAFEEVVHVLALTW
nr:ubiquitin carboxyl-terminal hydrolase 20-like [Tanacetum cinerariifolium]